LDPAGEQACLEFVAAEGDDEQAAGNSAEGCQHGFAVAHGFSISRMVFSRTAKSTSSATIFLTNRLSRSKRYRQGGPAMCSFSCHNSGASSRTKLGNTALLLSRNFTVFSRISWSAGSSRLTDNVTRPSLAYFVCISTRCGNSFLQGIQY